jgi:selenocysteine lyase/cysteine desulfurase
MLDQHHIQQLRKETPGVTHYIHLNNAGAALMPEQVLSAITDHLELEAQIGGYEAAAAQMRPLARFHMVLADFLNTRSRNIAYAGSATDAFNKALSSIPFEEGDVLLTTQDDYVSNHIAFIQLQRLKKIKLEVAPVDTSAGGVDLAAMEQLIKKHQPKLVAVTHIPTNSGLIQDVEAIGEMCRDKDTWYLVDACQSAGQLPLDVGKIGCDFLSATFRKFLRGPRGAGFLYVSDRALEAGLEPLFLDLHSAHWTAEMEYEAVHSAKRFELWERPHALILGGKAAVELAMNIGMEAIQERVQQLAKFTRESLGELRGVRVLDQGPELGGIVTFHVPGKEPKALKKQLQEQKVNCSIVLHDSALYDFNRKGVEWALRVSPHYYNLREEVQDFIEKLGAMMD